MILPSGEILPLHRMVGCGSIGSATHKLSMPTDNQAGDFTEATCVTTTCIDAGPHASHLAPTADITPRAVVGAFINTPVHGERF